MQPPPFVVSLIDDDPNFREIAQGLLVAAGYDVRSHGTATSFIDGHDPAALGCSLIDLRLGNDCGIEILAKARLSGHDAPVLIISAYGDIPIAVEAVRAGAFGFIEKRPDPTKFLATVAEACARHVIIRQTFGSAIDAIERYNRLTSREQDIYWLMVKSISLKEIAARLGISPRTAETHRGHMIAKMEIGSHSDIVKASFHLDRIFLKTQG